jgi:hypothetical protein
MNHSIHQQFHINFIPLPSRVPEACCIMNDPARARVRRADVVRRQQEENRQERIARIRKIQEPELARDYAALNQAIGPGPQFQGPTWFHSDYVDGSRNYVLETIGRIFTNSLDKKIIKEITDRVFDFAWLGQRYYDHEGVSQTSSRQSHALRHLMNISIGQAKLWHQSRH